MKKYDEISDEYTKENLEVFFDRFHIIMKLILQYYCDDFLYCAYQGSCSYEEYCKKSMIEEILREAKEYSNKETNLIKISSDDRFLFINNDNSIDLKEIYEKARERWLKEMSIKQIDKDCLEESSDNL